MKDENEVFIPLENVESEHCALIVDNGLSRLKEVSAHNVEVNNRRARISSDKLHVAIPEAVREIRSLGYNVPTVKKTFPVLGMSCASCANSIQETLQHKPGVVEGTVNYANATASVEFIPSLVTAQQLKSSIQAAGYDLVVEEGDEVKASLEEYHKEKFASLKKRTAGAIAFSVPLVVIAMVPALMHMPYANYIMWALATPVVLYYGRTFFIGAWKQLSHKSANMDTLVALSTGTAYLFSVFNTLFPDFWHSRGLHAHVYFEAAAVVIAFILLGKVLEEKAKGNTSSAIKKLMGLQPKSVIVLLPDGQQADTRIEEVKIGDTILVKPGEKIAVDGKVVSGSSYVDESMISGEPVPVAKSEDAQVFAGTINQKGSFQFRAEKVGSDTLLAQIIKTVEEAQGSKAPVQKLVDKIAGVFVPAVIIIAVLTLVAWIVLGGEDGFSHGIMAMVTVLVIACPCALGLATPTAVMVGVGKGAENGILIKDAESLETARNVNAVILDKTGTITEGKPGVKAVRWFVEESDELKSLLYTIEKSSEHPLADAIVHYFNGRGVTFFSDVAVENITGQGITGHYQNQLYGIGNEALMRQWQIELQPEVSRWISEERGKAQTVIAFFDHRKVLAAIAIADQIKDTSVSAVRALKNKGIEVYMLTGDNEQTAAAVAAETGIDHFRANVLPAEKADFVKQLQSEGKVVAMVGDGINDSNALARADVSIAMGKGSDIAMDVAKMTIISSDLSKIPQAIDLSAKTVKTIRQNLFWAFFYNIIGIPIAAGILFPLNGFLLDPMMAGAAMALSSVSVVTNSLRQKWSA